MGVQPHLALHHRIHHNLPPRHAITQANRSSERASLPRRLQDSLPGEHIIAMPTAGLKTIIALSFVLAVGFLLVILSCALFKVYYPLLVVATYIIAPVPNWICGRCANPDDFVESSGAAVMDLGRFFTGFFVVMGMALPVVLAHSGLIQIEAMIMSIVGGLLIYGTIVSFSMFFHEEQDF